MTVYFTYTLTREAEHEDAEDQVFELEVTATATGYDNTDVGCGGPNELDDWSIDEDIELTSDEEELIAEAAQEALNDS